jgi:glucokinase
MALRFDGPMEAEDQAHGGRSMSFYRGMTCENVTIKGDKGTPITAYVAKPSGPGPFPGVDVPAFDDLAVIASEGGHATLAATSPREDAIIDYLRRQFGHVSAERVVSGSGLENLYRAVVALDGVDAPERNAPEITKAGSDGTCPFSRMALELFCGMLGTIAGNIGLMFGARGGVYIAGGIAPRITDFIAHSEFRARFESKGRLQTYLQSIPTRIIIHPAATFVGLRTLVNCGLDPAGGPGAKES